ncbi:MAG TPA: redox-sensing transcriptional repressor Rex [bacterium]|nr:redox-sensing transcriptional repressor Rex [bacterium]
MTQTGKSASRLPCYRRALMRFKELGFDRVYSESLAESVGVTSSQVRKDFSVFGISGNKKGGYQIETLLDQLRIILKKDQIHPVILVGVGNIGTALMNYRAFERENIEIVAGFDIDPSKINKKMKIPVLPINAMDDYLKHHQVRIGIITVPALTAQQVCNRMVSAGIKGILNFAPIRLKVPDDTMIENVSVLLKLENIIYFVEPVVNTEPI